MEPGAYGYNSIEKENVTQTLLSLVSLKMRKKTQELPYVPGRKLIVMETR